MPKDQPVKSLVHKNLTIEGFSRAAVQTYLTAAELDRDHMLYPWEVRRTADAWDQALWDRQA